MRILYLMDQMYLHGGAERILSQKINYFIGHYGYEVHLLTTGQQGKKPVYELDPRLIWDDLGINYITGRSYFGPQNLIKTALHFLKLKKAIKRIKPDVIIAVSNSPDQYFLPFIAKHIPKIKEFHSSRFNFVATGFKAKLEKHLGAYAALVALNETEKQYYPAHNVVVIPNFTDFEYTGIPETREKSVIAAGRIAPVKQFDELARIWKTIIPNFPEWQLKIFGDGETNAVMHLKTLIKELDLSASVHLMHSVPDMKAEMLKASVYAMTSSTECFPMVLLEAQASHLPIVSYDCPNGPRHIITNDEDGFLVAQDDKEAFAKKLATLMNDAELRERFAEKASQNTLQFSKPAVMRQWNELINKNRK